MPKSTAPAQGATPVRSSPLQPRLRPPSPAALGLPPKFTRWWPLQGDAVYRIVRPDDERTAFTMLTMPTGTGKSVVYVAALALLDEPAVILTTTKGLQDQLDADFASMGLVEVRGANNYPCRLLEEWGHGTHGCDEGPCHANYDCPYKEKGCAFYDQVARARDARVVVTNYQFYLHAKLHMKGGLGPRPLLVCDESHDAPEQVSSFLAFELRHDVIGKLLETKLPEPDCELDQWHAWATYHRPRVLDTIAYLKDAVGHTWNTTQARHLRAYTDLDRQLALLCGQAAKTTVNGEWVIEGTKTGVQWTPLWPAPHTGSTLFKGVERVVLVSATVRLETASHLGIPRDRLEVVEYPAVYPVRNRPVYQVRTVQMNYRNEGNPLNVRLWTQKCVRIVQSRPHRKGLIHTTSYRRAEQLMQTAKATPEAWDRMFLPRGARQTRQFLTAHRNMAVTDGPVLVSPALTTGYDFPMDACRFQILVKIPFPDTRVAVTAARCHADKSYGPYLAMQVLVQTVGRGIRAAGDKCEALILDDNLRWFLRSWGHLAPQWFLESVRYVETIPPPMDLGQWSAPGRGVGSGVGAGVGAEGSAGRAASVSASAFSSAPTFGPV